MTTRQEISVAPLEILALLRGTVPERAREIEALWERYNPQVILASDAHRVTLDANKERIRFDAKTMDVFWLIGFAGWKAIECYSPSVVVSAATEQTLANVIADDLSLGDVERYYKERRVAAQALIDAADPSAVPWPDDIPRPQADRDSLDDPQLKAAFDLTCVAVAFTFLHEFRHVMLDHDDERPSDVREEEMACDVWAREFMTANLAAYGTQYGHDYAAVLRKRSMGLALSALIIYEITPSLYHGGSRTYFSTRDRLQAILDNTQLPDTDHFWIFAASLLVGIHRQRGGLVDPPTMQPKALALHLLEVL